MEYVPQPIDTSDVTLPDDLAQLTEVLAENTHNLWADRRMAENWRQGRCRDDQKKTHPSIVPYAELPESEKEYDRVTAMEAIKVILALGYEIRKTTDNAQGGSTDE